MPAGQGKDAERFAAAVESRTSLGAAGDGDLARELQIVAMLRSRGAEFAPDPEVKARAKQRLMAVLAAEQGGPGPLPRHADASSERTAPLDRLVEPAHPAEPEDVDPTEQTTRIAPVTAQQNITPAEDVVDDDTDRTTTAHTPASKRRGGRRARHSIANRPAGRARSAHRPVAGLRRRALVVGSAAMVAMLAIAGGGIFASQGALPGDNLYGIKRAAESAGLALTFDDAGKARRHLEIAATRLSEVEQLAAREPQAAPAPEVFTRAMDEFDLAVDEGSRLLLEANESGGSAGSGSPDGTESSNAPETSDAPDDSSGSDSSNSPDSSSSADGSEGSESSGSAESDLRAWAAEQSDRLTRLEPELPAAADADESLRLLERLLGRAESTDEDNACEDDECTSGREDGTSTTQDSDGNDDSEDTTTSPDANDQRDASVTDDPSRTSTAPSDGEDAEAGDVTPDPSRENEDEETTSSRSEDEDTAPSSDSESAEDGSEGGVSVPLPLLPPVTLPPLLPGLPGITIG
jgi:hypothetical protein